MPANKFRFISPGIQFKEIDQSTRPAVRGPVGPVIIGRSMRGPAFVPTRVENFSDFVRVFGEPQPGAVAGDIWRIGSEGLSPTYGAYAAQAYLANSSGITFIRLLGRTNIRATAATGTPAAGWGDFASGFASNASSKGGAYGLFLVKSGSDQAAVHGTLANVTGTLAAVFYMKDVESGAHLRVSGTNGSPGATPSQTASNALPLLNFESSSYTVEYCEAGAVQQKYNFNFSPGSGQFIRRMFNTNPTKINSTYYEDTENFWLGESFERDCVEKDIADPKGQNNVWMVMLGLQQEGGNTYKWHENYSSAGPATTNWIISQDIGAATSFDPSKAKKLFRIKSLELGENTQKNFKISFDDIRYSPDDDYKYGSFTLLLRDIRDNDNYPNVIESFTNLNLDPESPNYIAARIGNGFSRWDDDDKRFRYYGEYPNRSQYITVEMAEDVALGAVDPELLPFGYLGPPRPVSFALVSGSTQACTVTSSAPGTVGGENLNTSAFVTNALPDVIWSGNGWATSVGNFISCSNKWVGKFDFPRNYVRPDSTVGNLTQKDDGFWGFDTTLSGSSIKFDPSVIDTLRGIPDGYRTGEDGPALSRTDGESDYQYVFTLDDVSLYETLSDTFGATSSLNAYYTSGSRAYIGYTGYEAEYGGYSLSSTGSNTYKNTLDEGFRKFTVPMFGGFNGIDISQVEPFNNNILDGKTAQTSYAYNSVLNAVESVQDPESVDMNLLAAPGITNTGITDKIIQVCRERGDALGVIDIVGGYQPKADRSAASTRDYDSTARGSVSTTVTNMKTRQINNSYGAAYYPYVKVRDPRTGRQFFAPPSVAAIGTYSFSQALTDVWFAPAGFVRGGLSDGVAGLPVVGVSERLTSKERDQLYEVGVNPIASFPSEGIVVFGQKTLQATPSALDRVNVRRLLIHLKKGISIISSTVLFDPNLAVTWDRFKASVEPFLENIKSRLGLMDYRVVLDSSTTTPDMVDRNIMYAKIFIKPARAIEFIAIDFIITNSGASFSD